MQGLFEGFLVDPYQGEQGITVSIPEVPLNGAEHRAVEDRRVRDAQFVQLTPMDQLGRQRLGGGEVESLGECLFDRLRHGRCLLG